MSQPFAEKRFLEISPSDVRDVLHTPIPGHGPPIKISIGQTRINLNHTIYAHLMSRH